MDSQLKYQKLDSTNNLDDETATFSIKVLNKEASIELKNLSASTTVGELKEMVQKGHKVSTTLQRLIFCGKPLAPDDKTLISFGIKDQSVIHLFARVPTSVVSNESEAVSHEPFRGVPYSTTSPSLNFYIATHRPIHFDPLISQSIREVKLWSYILLIVSSMTIFSNISILTSTGELGSNKFDEFFNYAETIFAVFGLYVSQLGIRASVLVDIDTVKKYMYHICILSAIMVAMRLLWVIDVVILAKHDIHEARIDEKNEDQSTDDNNNPHDDKVMDDIDQNEQLLSPNFLIYFTVQACIIACIVSAMWVACASRAIRLTREVEGYERANQTPNNTVTLPPSMTDL